MNIVDPIFRISEFAPLNIGGVYQGQVRGQALITSVGEWL